MTERKHSSLKKNTLSTSYLTTAKTKETDPSISATAEASHMPIEHCHSARRDQALDWLLHLQQSPLEQELCAQFRQWYETDSANAQAYNKAKRLWHLTGQLAPTTAKNWLSPPPAPVLKHPAARRHRWVSAAVAACLLVALAPQIALRWQADYRTSVGEIRDITLSDGSTVLLDSNSAIALNFTNGQRDVQLLKGQAFFKVMPDQSKPFHVRADTMQVTVTGTSFNVDLNNDEMAVAVQHGSVNVDDWQARKALASLVPGQQLKYLAGQTQISTFIPTQAAAWRQRQLIADDTPIAEIMARIQPYTTGLIMLNDAQLGHQRVTGVYDLRNPKAALQALVQPYGGKVSSYGPWLMVLHKK